MKFKDLFEKWELSSIKLNIKFGELEFKANPQDEEAAWEMYVELITRITTQPLSEDCGDERSALESVYSLFAITRDILKTKGRKCDSFVKIAIVVLNQVVRPFTSKWHKLSLEGAFDEEEKKKEFRAELKEIQKALSLYSKMLAEIAKVEDLTFLSE